MLSVRAPGFPQQVPRARALLHADVAAGASLVLDDERLSERLRELLADDASQRIRRPAGGKRNDDADRPIGIRRLRKRPAVSHDEGGK